MEFDIRKKDGYVYVEEKDSRIGIRFEEGEPLQSYVYANIIPDWFVLDAEDGQERMLMISEEAKAYAAKLYPYEFRELEDSGE